MTNKAINIRKMYRRAFRETINKSNGHYYYVDKIDHRVYRLSNTKVHLCPRLAEPYTETYAIPDVTGRVRFSQNFDTETNTFILKEL